MHQIVVYYTFRRNSESCDSIVLIINCVNLPVKTQGRSRRLKAFSWKQERADMERLLCSWGPHMILLFHNYDFYNVYKMAIHKDIICVYYMKVKMLVVQSCPTLCMPIDCSLSGSSVQRMEFLPGILQARILEWFAIPFSRGIFLIQGPNLGLLHCRQIVFTIWAIREAQ